MTDETMTQKGFWLFVSLSLWVKSNAPGPSLVPAAKEYPRAAGQV